jgi:hypothetical protein
MSYVLLYRAMACPYFFPVARFESSPWSVPPRLPLGDAFSGECRAPGDASQPALQPDETRMREICNVGYGRYGCTRFPADAAADAVRFHVAEDAGELIHIQYIFEKDCWPVEHGMAGTSANETLRRQAEAFAECYRRRRAQV